MDIDNFRKNHLAIAEMVDSWRLIPRMIIAGYTYFLVKITMWYMSLHPYMLDGCDIKELGQSCLIQAPTTQHIALITAIVGVSAAVFGLYSNSGKKWNGFTLWNKNSKKEPEKENLTD